MSDLASRIAARFIQSGARWKDEGWRKPTPHEAIEKAHREPGTKIIHFSDVGPGFQTGRDRKDIGKAEDGSDVQPSGGFKVGINPNTTHETPVGVYGYPLTDETLRKWFGKDGKRPPFAAARSWMYVLKVRDPVILQKDGTSAQFNKTDLEHAARNIAASYPRLINEVSSGGLELSGASDAHLYRETTWYKQGTKLAKHQTPFVQLWNLTRILADRQNSPAFWTRLLLREGDVEAALDLGSKTLHKNEPVQAVALTPRAYDVVDVVENIYTWSMEKQEAREQAEWHQIMQRRDVDPARYGGLDLDGILIRSRKRTKGQQLEYFLDALDEDGRITTVLQAAEPRSGGRIKRTGKHLSYFEVDGLTFDGTFDGFIFKNCVFKNCTFVGRPYDGWGYIESPNRFKNCTFLMNEGTFEPEVLAYARKAMPEDVTEKKEYMMDGDQENSAALSDVLSERLGIRFDSPTHLWLKFDNCTLDI